MYAQVIDDVAGKDHLRCFPPSVRVQGNREERCYCRCAAALGLIIGKKAQENGVTEVVFDRGGNLYHGRIKQLPMAPAKQA